MHSTAALPIAPKLIHAGGEHGVVRDSNSGRQLLLPTATWCPMFASRTTHRAHYYEALNASPFADEAEWLGWRRKLSINGGGIVMDGGQSTSHWRYP